MAGALASFVFWFSAIALVFTYLGYPLLVALLSGRRSSFNAHPPREWPLTSVVLVAHNEAARIAARLENLLASDYPPACLEIIVVCDGSTDGTGDEIARLADEKIRVVRQPERRGKAAGLNAGIAAAKGEIIVFADARQTFAAPTIRWLVASFTDPRVGAVSGELEIAESADGIGRGVDVYWRLERFLRAREAALDSCIGCTGAVYAIRRALFSPLPEDTILDDVVIPMRIAVAGKRVAFCDEARAFDPQPLDPATETRRKRRTLAGNFQMLFRHPAWLLPWHNRLWWQLAAHKYLRLAGPVLLVAVFVANAMLVSTPLYLAAFMAQLAFYCMAVLGTRVPSRWFTIPAGFVFLNVNVARAAWDYWRGGSSGKWAGAKSEPSDGPPI